MKRDSDVNPVYEKWKLSTGMEKEKLLQELIHRLEKFATAICWQRLPDHASELEAMVNGIVWKALDQEKKFNGRSKFSTWFYTIVVNQCNDFLRAKERSKEITLENEPNTPAAVDARLDIIKIFAKLDANERVLFRLVAEGNKWHEIGKNLGVTKQAAHLRWKQLTEKIRNAQ